MASTIHQSLGVGAGGMGAGAAGGSGGEGSAAAQMIASGNPADRAVARTLKDSFGSEVITVGGNLLALEVATEAATEAAGRAYHSQLDYHPSQLW